MNNSLRKYALGALAAGTIAGGAALGLPGAHLAWQPAPFGLRQTPAQLLPATVSSTRPVRVVTTTLDHGRPVSTVRTATDMTTAAALVKQGQTAANALGVQVDHRVYALSAPTGTDPMRGQQWDFSKIHVADAWAKSTGAGVTVAVIDTGVDATHPDLAGQVLTGYDEISGTVGGNTDPNGHGTHVAGTIAALTGNGVGVSAIAPDTRILPIRVLGSDGSGYMSDAANGIVYAADHGAEVINMSLGSEQQDSSVTTAITYARSKGVVVVAAAGNERSSGSPVSYPAADPGVIAVAATDSNDNVASYSNQGSYVDVAAPGSAILSTYPTALASSGYNTLYGTSMASPHVAAVAALLKAYNPELTPDQVEQALESSAVDLGTAGKDSDYGYGRIDAAAALAAVTPATTAPATSAATTAATTSPATTSPTTTTAPTTSAPASTDPTTAPTSADPTSADPTVDPTTDVVTPAVSLNATARLIRYGTTPTVTFTVAADGTAMAGQTAQVCVAVNGAAYQCSAVTTDGNGVVTWAQRATSPFRIRLAVPATDGTAAVTSAAANYQMQAVVTATKASTRSLTVTIGGVDRQTVTVQRLDGTRWVTAKTFKAATRTTVTGLTAKKRYRVVVPNATSYTGATSATVAL
jgi:serine protease